MASTWSALKIELLETGQNSGQWGNLTNINLGDAVLGEAITGSATVDFATDADVTITLTDSATTQSARNLRLNITESSSGVGSVRNLILGSGCQIEKFYLVRNNGTGAKTIKNTSGTGISVPAGKATLVYNDGTNVVDAASYFTSLTLGSALPVASGGTGSTSTTFVNLASNVTGTLPAANGGTGVANNAAMTVTGSGNFAYTRTLTAATNVTFPTTGTLSTLAGSETLTNKTIAFGSNTLSDVASLSTAQTFTATKTFSGSSSVLAEVLSNAAEVATVSATAATGTINYDVTTQSVLYYTSNASGNWTVNFRASSGTSLNTAMSTGQSVTAAFLVTQGATAYYNSVVQVDGSTVTPKYQGGTAYASGNASSVDVYMYTIVKTGNAAFTVFTSQTKFA